MIMTKAPGSSTIGARAPTDTSWTPWMLSISCTGLSTAVLCLAQRYYYQKKLRQVEQKWSSFRQEERTGRIRAEVRLRTASKELDQIKQKQQQNANDSNSGEHKASPNDTTMLLRCIGTVSSPYKKRMGTPRQPQLVPSSRGVIDFTCQAAALDGIQDYSHVWIIFEFHANTNIDSNNKKTKIRPPRAGGIKVGQLATRSPHRPNCLGLSLVRVERWEECTRQLHVSGLDLVHGTPVYDIKPCVPWDVPNFYQNKALSKTLMISNADDNDGYATTRAYRVPHWVQQADALSSVSFTPDALQDLQSVVEQGCLSPFYTTKNDGAQVARQSLEEILAQDPRSSHKGLKSNARGTATNQKEDPYSFLFGNAEIQFVVTGNDKAANEVLVLHVVPIDTEAFVHADGIPLVTQGLD